MTKEDRSVTHVLKAQSGRFSGVLAMLGRCIEVTKNPMTQGRLGGLVVLAVCLGLANHLQAFSVGDIDVQSAANEPFRAEIRYVLEAHERDREFEVVLGTDQDYQLEDLERPSLLQHMHVVLAPDKRDTVRIFSNVPMMEDTFDLLVLLRSGRLTIVRNYPVELQEFATAAQQKAVVEPDDPPAAAEPLLPPPQAAPAAEPSAVREPEIAAAPVGPAVVDSTDPYGPIERGETMYNVVGKLDVPRDQRWQAVVLLWRTNHDAFLRGNLHGLLVGAQLDIPANFADRLQYIDKETSQRIIADQWQAWRSRRVTSAAEVLAMTMDLRAGEEEPIREGVEQLDGERLSRHDEAPVIDGTDSGRRQTGSEEGRVATPAPEPVEVTEAAEAAPESGESIADGGTADTAREHSPVEPRLSDLASQPEESVPDESVAAVAPPQVMRLPTDEGSTFVSTQELKLLLGNLESRLLRRLAPVQEVQDGASFVSPTELHVSLQDLENRLTQRVEQIVAQGGTQVSPEPPAQPGPTSLPPAGLQFVAGIQMPPVAYLLVLINVILLVFSLTLGWRWWRQSARGES